MNHKDRSNNGGDHVHYHFHDHPTNKSFKSNRKRGYGVNLYRNTRDNKIAGVCAGLADHFEISHWVMRVLFITALLFTGALAIWAYIIAWVLLAPSQPDKYEESFEYDERRRCYRKKNVFRYSESTSQRIQRAQQRMEQMAQRVGKMEEYVTSKRFKLDREFSKL